MEARFGFDGCKVIKRTYTPDGALFSEVQWATAINERMAYLIATMLNGFLRREQLS